MNGENAELTPEALGELWDFKNPTASGERFDQFRERAAAAGLDDLAAIATTQIARSLGLEQRFDEGLALLDAVEQGSPGVHGELRVRIKLERGRLLNSSGRRALSVPEFTKAWEQARQDRLDALGVDAAHMLGIVLDGLEAMDWNEQALRLAIASDQPAANAWKGSLLNNMGWLYHEAGSFEQAMELFESALEFRLMQGKPAEICAARWCIARCFRSLGRFDVALAVLRSLEKTQEADGYVYEEIGECFFAQGDAHGAKPYFAKAYQLLAQVPWFIANESPRLDRIRELSA